MTVAWGRQYLPGGEIKINAYKPCCVVPGIPCLVTLLSGCPGLGSGPKVKFIRKARSLVAVVKGALRLYPTAPRTLFPEGSRPARARQAGSGKPQLSLPGGRRPPRWPRRAASRRAAGKHRPGQQGPPRGPRGAGLRDVPSYTAEGGEARPFFWPHEQKRAGGHCGASGLVKKDSHVPLCRVPWAQVAGWRWQCRPRAARPLPLWERRARGAEPAEDDGVLAAPPGTRVSVRRAVGVLTGPVGGGLAAALTMLSRAALR